MKKTIVLLTVIIASASLHVLRAQAVPSGKLEAQLAVGFGLYALSDNVTDDVNSIGLPGLVNIKVQYAITKWFSPGLMYERNGFITDPDSAENAKSGNIYLSLTFRLANTEKTAVFTSLNFGSSSYTYRNEFSKEKVTAEGGAFQWAFGIKHFISEHIGIGYDFALTSYAYDELKVGDTVFQIWDADKKTLANYEINFVGVNHRIGVTYQF
jgi:hypothetical protein